MGPKSRSNRRPHRTVQLRPRNYGLDLLRGHGVPRDPILGRKFVDRAATAGLDVARELQDAAYDPAAVTPDADEWKYEKRVF